jgi:hypothetical protein
MLKRAHRRIECAIYQDLCAYTLAFEDLCHVKEVAYTVEPTFLNVETLVWWRIVRIDAKTSQELSPFKELLDLNIDGIYDYLRDACARSMKERELRNGY